MITTLEQIRAHSPCTKGWTKLLAHLGKTRADDEPLPLSVVLESNGLDDTLWCFRAVRGFDREQRLFAVWCARQVEHLMTDRGSLEALAVAERYANGLASTEELASAAAYAYAPAAYTATAYAATAYAATRAASAARDAAWSAAWSAARDAARDTTRATQTQELKRVLACTEAGIDPYPRKEWCAFAKQAPHFSSQQCATSSPRSSAKRSRCPTNCWRNRS